MTLIQRQDRITRALENIYRRKWQNPGQRSGAVYRMGLFNAKRMAFAGYSKDEAKASFAQCVDMAQINVSFERSFAPQ